VRDAIPRGVGYRNKVVKERFLLLESGNKFFGSFLLFLGFCDQSAPLSASFEFFRKLTGLYVKILTQTPDLEVLRERVNPILTAGEIDDLLSQRPYMVGAEYIDSAFLESIWSKLNITFRNKVKTHKGSVDEFIKTFSPDIHLAGRVYFHLVESKKEDLPFAFLATYSTGLNEQGKSKHVPLKHALTEYGENSKKLLELLTTVYSAAKESRIVAIVFLILDFVGNSILFFIIRFFKFPSFFWYPVAIRNIFVEFSI